MKQFRFFSYIGLLSLLLSACARPYYVQEAAPVQLEDPNFYDDSVDVGTIYGGDAFRYIVFELDVKNNGTDTLFFNDRDVTLNINAPYEGLNKSKYRILQKEYLIEALVYEKEDVNREKRARTTGNAVVAGLDVLSFALGGGGVGAVIYGAESAIYIMDDRRQYKMIEGDIEEQINYIDQYALGDVALPPGEAGSWDLIFDRDMIDVECTLEVVLNKKVYPFEYDLFVAKKK